MYQFARFLGLAVVIGVAGCAQGKAPSYANVSGTVNYNGKPLDKGQIVFTSDGHSPTQTEIVDGKFAGQAMVGSNKVQVSAYRKPAKERALPPQALAQMKAYQAMGKTNSAGNSVEPGMEDYIPPEWGRDSKQTRVIEAGAPNSFEFNIKGK